MTSVAEHFKQYIPTKYLSLEAAQELCKAFTEEAEGTPVKGANGRGGVILGAEVRLHDNELPYERENIICRILFNEWKTQTPYVNETPLYLLERVEVVEE